MLPLLRKGDPRDLVAWWKILPCLCNFLLPLHAYPQIPSNFAILILARTLRVTRVTGDLGLFMIEITARIYL
jgi:hypothetical protein